MKGLTQRLRNRSTNHAKGRRKKKGTYLAVGRRVRMYKNYLAKTTSNHTDARTERLRDRPGPGTEPNTPPGNTSIAKHFAIAL
jgi:hypothetical protein